MTVSSASSVADSRAAVNSFIVQPGLLSQLICFRRRCAAVTDNDQRPGHGRRTPASSIQRCIANCGR